MKLLKLVIQIISEVFMKNINKSYFVFKMMLVLFLSLQFSLFSLEMYEAKHIGSPKLLNKPNVQIKQALINNKGQVVLQYNYNKYTEFWTPDQGAEPIKIDQKQDDREWKIADITSLNDAGKITGLGYYVITDSGYSDPPIKLVNKRIFTLNINDLENTFVTMELDKYPTSYQAPLGTAGQITINDQVLKNVGIMNSNNDNYHYAWTTRYNSPGSATASVEGRILVMNSDGKLLNRKDSNAIKKELKNSHPEFIFGRIEAVNNASSIVGYVLQPDSGLKQGFIYKDGNITLLETSDKIRESYPLAFNNKDQIVGTIVLKNGVSNAALWDGGQLVNLNEVVDYTDIESTDKKLVLSEAMGINDQGQIVAKLKIFTDDGSGDKTQQLEIPVLLTPVETQP